MEDIYNALTKTSSFSYEWRINNTQHTDNTAYADTIYNNSC